MNPSPTIAITGGTIWGNRGAEAMLVTTLGRLRESFPDARFHVLSYTPQRDRALITDRRVTVLSVKPSSLVLRHFPFAVLVWLAGLLRIRLPDAVLSNPVRQLRQCDVLLDVSGISFADGRTKFLPFNILLIWPALLLGVPVVKLAQAVGPFKTPVNRLAARLFLARCRHIFGRGEVTASHLENLKLSQDRWDLSADLAFLYQPGYSLSSENEDRLNALTADLDTWRQAGHPVIAIIPSSLVYARSGAEYVGQLLQLITGLDETCRFVLLPNATREGSDKTFNNDLVVIQAVRARLPEAQQERVRYVDYDVNTAGTRQVLERCDLTLTSRFHGMISSLCLGVPPVVIGWGHKYLEVMTTFGIETYVTDFSDAGSDVLALVAEALHSRAALHTQIETVLPSVRALATQQLTYVESLLS